MAEKTYTTNPLKGKETLKRLKGVLRNAPVIGTVADVVDIGKEVLTGDYAGAAVAAGTALAGVTPIGRIASKGAKVVSKKLKKKPVIKEDVPTVEAAGLTDEDIAKFRKPESEGGRGTSSEFREALKGRNPELQELAKKVKEGKISVKEYRNRADEIRPIRLVSEVPKPATNKEIVSALNSKQRQNPLIGLNATIPEKDIVEVRLNIPAYTDYNVWIPTIRHNKKEKYKAAIKIQNVKFIQPDSSGSKKALNVATGVEKSPFAVMTGEYVDGSDDELFNMAKKVFDDDEWTQVGYDPIKRGFFYDRATGEAILEADEVIQVGHLVLAKNAKKTDPDFFSFNQGGLTIEEQTQQAFNQGGYGVAGKFTPDTGVSAAKEKGNFKGLGYKGETIEPPEETNKVTGDPSKDKSDRTVRPLVPAPFEKGQFDKYKRVDPETYTGLKFKQTDKDQPLGFLGEPTNQTLKQRQEEVKRTKRFSGLSETAEMASSRVNFNNVRNALNFDIEKKKYDKEFKYAYDNLFPDVVKSIIDKNYFIRNVVSDNEDLGTYKTVWSSNLNEKDDFLVVAQFIAEAIGGNVADIDPTSDDWAWCSAFVDHILSSVGAERVSIAGESYAPVRVKSYLNYGKQVKGGIKGGKTGDIVIINPDFDNTVDHAGFLIGPELYDIFNLKPEAGQFYMLGGNQGNAVNIIKRNVSIIEGVRRISEITEKDKNQLKKDNPLFEEYTKALDARSQIMVRSGDSMSKIAQKLGIPLKDFIKLNKKLGAIEDANEIKVGQKLYYNQGGLTMEQQMSGLMRRPIKAHQGTIVNGQIVYDQPDAGGQVIPPPPTPAPFVPPTRDPAPINQPVPTTPPVTDFTPAPTPVAPMPVPAPAPTPAPFVPPSRDPVRNNQPVPTEPPVTITAPEPVAPTPVPAPAPVPAPFVPPTRDPIRNNQPVPTEPPVTVTAPPSVAPTPVPVADPIVAPPPAPVAPAPLPVPKIPGVTDILDPKPMTESEQISRYGKPQRYFGNQILKPGYYAGPADGIYKYGEGPYAEQTQAYLDSVGMTFEQFAESADWEASGGLLDVPNISLDDVDIQPAVITDEQRRAMLEQQMKNAIPTIDVPRPDAQPIQPTVMPDGSKRIPTSPEDAGFIPPAPNTVQASAFEEFFNPTTGQVVTVPSSGYTPPEGFQKVPLGSSMGVKPPTPQPPRTAVATGRSGPTLISPPQTMPSPVEAEAISRGIPTQVLDQIEDQQSRIELESSPEYKALKSADEQLKKLMTDEVGSYQRKYVQAIKQFGRDSSEARNALEGLELAEKGARRKYANEIAEFEKAQQTFIHSDANTQYNLIMKERKRIRDLRRNRQREAFAKQIEENKNIRNAVARQIIPKKALRTDLPIFNKGGMTMEQQMNLFEQGGMKDDGLDKDPVSGNDIPPGSLAKEVRDDIPAQLSEGEYVVPADVVQYYGVKFFEDLRAEAKRGLAQMEATGRIGGEPVSTTIIAIGQAEEEEKKKKALGGIVGYSNGGLEDQIKQDASTASFFDPSDYAVTGAGPASALAKTAGYSKAKDNVTFKTYYHSQTGESKQVKFVNGIVTPPGDVKFTQPPWSTTKPTPTQVRKDDKDRPADGPPGWGADPAKFDFSGYTTEKEWSAEVDNLLKPVGGILSLGKIGGFLQTAGVANAYAAIQLAKAKGIDTSNMEEKYQKAYDNLGSFGKGIVDFSNKLLGKPGEYAETVASTNPSYRNLKRGTTTTTTKAPIKSPEQLKKEQQDNEDRRQARERNKAIVEDRLKADKDKDYMQSDAIDKKVKEREEADDPFERTGEKRAKGGLINKPKRKPKKPRGKGLGSK